MLRKTVTNLAMEDDIPFCESLISELSNKTVSTMLSSLPPTDPTERPWPPEQTPPEKVMPWKKISLCSEKSTNVLTYSSGVDSNTVILIIYISARDGDACAGSNVKTISVSTKIISITILCINGNSGYCQIACAVNAHHLDGWVVNVKVLDLRGNQVVCVKEFGFCLSSVGTFSIPVRSSAAIEVGTSGLSNGDICS